MKKTELHDLVLESLNDYLLEAEKRYQSTINS
jgi:hypothetical protein